MPAIQWTWTKSTNSAAFDPAAFQRVAEEARRIAADLAARQQAQQQREQERQAEKEKRMSKQITNLDEINLAAGEVIVVRQADSGEEVLWTSDGKGSFDNDGASLEAEAFESAIYNGNVFMQVPHHVGEVLSDGGYFYKIMAKEGEDWVMVKTDGRGVARSTQVIVGHVPTNLYPEPAGENQYTLPAFSMAYELHQARAVSDRLNRILESGEVPPEVPYEVKVQVRGTMQVQPSQAQAKRMVGDAQVKVARVGATDVTYDKEVTVTKTSRWGCACDQVGTPDLAESAPGVETWKVLGCTPAA